MHKNVTYAQKRYVRVKAFVTTIISLATQCQPSMHRSEFSMAYLPLFSRCISTNRESLVPVESEVHSRGAADDRADSARAKDSHYFLSTSTSEHRSKPVVSKCAIWPSRRPHQFYKVPHENDGKLEEHVTCEWVTVTSLNE
jgi:hypothetical protein